MLLWDVHLFVLSLCATKSSPFPACTIDTSMSSMKRKPDLVVIHLFRLYTSFPSPIETTVLIYSLPSLPVLTAEVLVAAEMIPSLHFTTSFPLLTAFFSNVSTSFFNVSISVLEVLILAIKDATSMVLMVVVGC